RTPTRSNGASRRRSRLRPASPATSHSGGPTSWTRPSTPPQRESSAEAPAMRVLILTVGTRGDIAPFAAFAERLAAEGHDVALGAPEAYRDTVPDAVRFEPMATEMDDVMRAGMGEST